MDFFHQFFIFFQLLGTNFKHANMNESTKLQSFKRKHLPLTANNIKLSNAAFSRLKFSFEACRSMCNSLVLDLVSQFLYTNY
jgi:hypothetical protein